MAKKTKNEKISIKTILKNLINKTFAGFYSYLIRFLHYFSCLFIKNIPDNNFCTLPIENKIPSRTKYAKQVASVIRKYHGKGEDSFIFGLSGKWGAGKTTFLKLLRKELECKGSKDFVVVYVSPWKFGSEITTFLRNFLKELNSRAEKEVNSTQSNITRYFRKILQSNFLKNLDHDITKPSFDFFNVINIFLVMLVILWLIYKFLVFFQVIPWQRIVELNQNQLFQVPVTAIYSLISVLALPILLTRIIINTKNEKVLTLDQFNEFYDKILLKFNNKNIVIFVDDLDRVSPEIARTVLDSLRTFVDKTQVSYVVTGDHSVLEKHIGSQVDESGTGPEKVEEGRRYLKKMFNVYWPLPIPTNQEFNIFLNAELGKKLEDLKKIVFSQSIGIEAKELEILNKWLFTYFDKNFRNIIRFLETVIFNFGLVNTQLETADDDLMVQLEEIKMKPLLFIRILMIQELAAPLYEEFTKDPTKIRMIEEDLENNSNQELEKIIKYLRDDIKVLSTQQEKFIRVFMYEKPRFYVKGKGLNVHSINPFIFIASSSDFSDLRGPTTDDFMKFISNQDIESISSALQNSGDVKLNDIKKKLLEHLNSLKTSDLSKFLLTITTLLNALKIINKQSLIQTLFFDIFLSLELKPIFQSSQPVELRTNLTIVFSEWLDLLDEDLVFASYFDLLKISDQNESNRVEMFIKQKKNFGKFSSALACKFLVYMFGINQDKALTLLKEIEPDYHITGISEFLDIKESVATEFAVHPETTKGEQLWILIKEINDVELNLLVLDKFVEHITAGGRYHITNWIAANFEEIKKYVDITKIENAVVTFVKRFFNDHGNLVNHISNNQALFSHFSEQIWNEAFDLGDAELFNLLDLFAKNSSLAGIVPNESQSTDLMLRMIQYSEEFKLTGQAIEEAKILGILQKTQLWHELNFMAEIVKVKIRPKKKSDVKNMVVKEIVEKIFTDWS